MAVSEKRGPLAGVRVVEVAAIGPVPYAGMLLADLGADVVRIDRLEPDPATTWGRPELDVLGRGKRSIALNLKDRRGVDALLRIVSASDALLEGFRPGVAERMGFGPDVCLDLNPALVFARMTGWGQSGPLAAAAGHDINYIALTGALKAIGPAEGPPSIPLNLVGDFGGGALFLALGGVSALFEARRSGLGQVVDTAMVDGAASLCSIFYVMSQIGVWSTRGTNFLDGGAPYYGVYETADGKYVAVGAIEPKFFAELLRRLDLDGIRAEDQHDRAKWPELRRRFAERIRTRTRAEWCASLEGTDACFAPVLSFDEAAQHPHMLSRGTIVEREGVRQPAPAPRFSRSRPGEPATAPEHGADAAAILADCGFETSAVQSLIAAGVVGRGPSGR